MLTETGSPARPNSRSAQKARTRQALLDAAVGVIRDEGLGSATARAISDRAGVAVGTFFVHFPEVAALMDELLDQQLQRSLERALRTLPDDAPLVDALVDVADSLFAGYAKEAELARAFLTATIFRADVSGPSHARLAEFRSWALDRMVRARTAGELSPAVDLDATFEAFFCLYFGLVVGGLRGELTRRRQSAVLRSTLAAMLGGAR